MNRQTQFANVVRDFALFFIMLVTAAQFPIEASAFTISSEEAYSSNSLKNWNDSMYETQPSPISLNMNKRDGSWFNHQKNDDSDYKKEDGSIPYFEQNSFHIADLLYCDFLKGDFHQIDFEHSRRHHDFPFFWDELGKDPIFTPSPSPVPLSSTVLFFGSGLTMIASLVLRNRICL